MKANLEIKILAYKSPQRYVVQRAVIAAQQELCTRYPDLQVKVSEIKQRAEIENYTAVIIYPSLVVNERLVCVGRFPRKDEVVLWMQQALEHS
jgi:hypothetical protein